MAKGRQPAPDNETKRGKFVRLCNPRITRAVAAIESIGKLGSSAYERTVEDATFVEKILKETTAATVEKLRPKAAGAAASAKAEAKVWLS